MEKVPKNKIEKSPEELELERLLAEDTEADRIIAEAEAEIKKLKEEAKDIELKLAANSFRNEDDKEDEKARQENINAAISNVFDPKILEQTPPTLPPQQELEHTPEQPIKLSKLEKEQIGFGLSTIGYSLEKKKNDFFAKVFGRIVSEKTDLKYTKQRVGDKDNSFFIRFCKELRDSFEKDAEEARKKGLAIKKGEDKSKISKVRNASLFTGNLLKYGRLIADATGLTPGTVQRVLMTGGMVVARGGEAVKEAVLNSVEASNETRIQDADKAAEEAWDLYEKAGGTLTIDKTTNQTDWGFSGSGNIKTEDLQNIYLKNIPKELQLRLQDPGNANNFIQKIITEQIKFSLDRLEEDLALVGYSYVDKFKNQILRQKIKTTEKTPKELKIERQKLLKKWEKRLQFYDRVISTYGTVNTFAMLADYAQKTGQAVVIGTQLQTLYKTIISIPKMWETVSHIFSNSHEGNPTNNVSKPNKGFFSDTIDRAKKFFSGDSETKAEQPVKAESVIVDPNTPQAAPEPAKVEGQAPAPAPAKPVPAEVPATGTPAPAPAVEKAGAVTGEFSLELGKNGVPANLETVFTSIAANQMKLPEGGEINEEFATKALNMGANLVRLAEGDDTLDIKASEFEDAASFTNGQLDIKDMAKFNAIVTKLQEHANKSWENGTLSSKGSAHEYIGNINKEGWLKIIRAEGMDEVKTGDTTMQTGIKGHDNVTLDKIADFKKFEHEVEGSTEAEDKAWAALVNTHEHEYNDPGDYPHEQHTPNKIDTIRANLVESYDTEISKGEEDRINYYQTDLQEAQAYKTRAGDSATKNGFDDLKFAYGSIELKEVLDTPGFKKNPFKLTDPELVETWRTYRKNINSIFNNEELKAQWKTIRKVSAEKSLGLDITPNNPETPFLEFIRRVQAESILEPKKVGFLFNRRPETIEEYLARAFQKIKKNGELDRFKN